MKKIILLAFVLLLLSTAILSTQLVITADGSTTHDVYPSDSIQEAINSVQSGDTIFVHSGTYYEHVVVNKSVSLIGENKHTTIVDGGAVQFDVIYVTANNVTISGFTLQRGGRDRYPDRRGIYIYSSNNNISGNIIRNNVEGIFVCMSNNNIFRNNSIHVNNMNGIWLVNSSNNTITCNTISNNGRYGMILQGDCSNNLIFHNSFIRNEYKNHYIATTGVCVNDWDKGYPHGGNYWSGYNGTDLFSGSYQNETSSDGIGDIPYTIDGNNRDIYPLMGMFYDFTVEVGLEQIYHVHVISNSTVSNLEVSVWLSSPNEYLQSGDKFIRFNVAGEEGSVGFCRITIPKVVLNGSYVILVDWHEIPVTEPPISNSTHAYLYFTYTQPNELTIVPEFPMWVSMLLILIVLTVVIAIRKRKLLKTSIHQLM